MRPRIALNALVLRPGGTGVATYARELLQALPAAVDADLTATVQADAVAELPPEVTAHEVPVATGVRRALAAMRAGVPADLLHGLDAVLPLRTSMPSVVTVHDLSVFDVPGTFTRRRAMGKRWQLRRAMRSADAVIAVSGFTADRVRARFGREARIVPEAPPSDCTPPSEAELDAVRQRYQLPERFVLHVGTIEPRKGVGVLADVCRALSVPLVLAGSRSPRATSRNLRATLLEYVPRRDLLALYGSASVVAYPSLYEGFGLPPLEALACGAPVLATRVGALPEVLGDTMLVPPGDAAALAAGLRDLLGDADRRVEMVAAGRGALHRLSWARTAEMTADVYRSLGIAGRAPWAARG